MTSCKFVRAIPGSLWSRMHWFIAQIAFQILSQRSRRFVAPLRFGLESVHHDVVEVTCELARERTICDRNARRLDLPFRDAAGKILRCWGSCPIRPLPG